MANVVRNLKNGSLVIQDNGGANSLTVPLDRGTLTFEEAQEAQTILTRGALQQFTDGPEQPCAISFSCWFHEYEGKGASGADPSVPDALKLRGNASAWVTTNGQTAPKTVDLVFTIADVETSGGENEVFTFSDFHADNIRFSEGEDGNLLEVTGKALVTVPAITRT